MTPTTPTWVIVMLAILAPIEAFGLGLILWQLKRAAKTRDEMFDQVKRTNGTVREHSSWIAGHEKWATDMERRFSDDISGLESRERERWGGRSGR